MLKEVGEMVKKRCCVGKCKYHHQWGKSQVGDQNMRRPSPSWSEEKTGCQKVLHGQKRAFGCLNDWLEEVRWSQGVLGQFLQGRESSKR